MSHMNKEGKIIQAKKYCLNIISPKNIRAITSHHVKLITQGNLFISCGSETNSLVPSLSLKMHFILLPGKWVELLFSSCTFIT